MLLCCRNRGHHQSIDVWYDNQKCPPPSRQNVPVHNVHTTQIKVDSCETPSYPPYYPNHASFDFPTMKSFLKENHFSDDDDEDELISK